VDDIKIMEAPANNASYTYTCTGANTATFKNTSTLCPSLLWDFGDPTSGPDNSSTLPDPTHIFSAPGKYTVKLTASGPGNAPSTITKDIYIIKADVTMLSMVDCQSNSGGSLIVSVEGATGVPLSYSWNTIPIQTTPVISNLTEGIYTVSITGTDVCPVTANGKAEKDISCIGIFFPSAITPDGNGKNDGFGPLGSLLSLSDYHLNIYNRWGELVFRSTDPFEKWYGKVKSYATDSNVFVWMAEFRVAGKDKELRKGTVMLIR